MTETAVSPTIEVSIEIDAAPEQVWAIVSDLKRMGEWSPQCRKMKVFGGEVRKGAKTLNLNRKGLLHWPTSSTVVEFEPNRLIAFRIRENTTIWSYELTPSGNGTTLVERREAPRGTSAMSQFMIKHVLGGNDDFERDLHRGMTDTVLRIKAEAERG